MEIEKFELRKLKIKKDLGIIKILTNITSACVIFILSSFVLSFTTLTIDENIGISAFCSLCISLFLGFFLQILFEKIEEYMIAKENYDQKRMQEASDFINKYLNESTGK